MSIKVRTYVRGLLYYLWFLYYFVGLRLSLLKMSARINVLISYAGHPTGIDWVEFKIFSLSSDHKYYQIDWLKYLSLTIELEYIENGFNLPYLARFWFIGRNKAGWGHLCWSEWRYASDELYPLDNVLFSTFNTIKIRVGTLRHSPTPLLHLHTSPARLRVASIFYF